MVCGLIPVRGRDQKRAVPYVMMARVCAVNGGLGRCIDV